MDTDAGRFYVADLAYHNDVRVLTQNTAQSVGEGESGFIVDSDLIDAVDTVLNRVFDRDDVFAGVVDISQRRIQRGRLTAARRTCNQHDAIGRTEQIAV